MGVNTSTVCSLPIAVTGRTQAPDDLLLTDNKHIQLGWFAMGSARCFRTIQQLPVLLGRC